MAEHICGDCIHLDDKSYCKKLERFVSKFDTCTKYKCKHKRHKWNGKISRRNPFVTCVQCGLVKESAMVEGGYMYWDRFANVPKFTAGHCVPPTR